MMFFIVWVLVAVVATTLLYFAFETEGDIEFRQRLHKHNEMVERGRAQLQKRGYSLDMDAYRDGNEVWRKGNALVDMASTTPEMLD